MHVLVEILVVVLPGAEELVEVFVRVMMKLKVLLPLQGN